MWIRTRPPQGQIIYQLLKELGAEPDPAEGEAIYAAIATDTGDFTYSNTQKRAIRSWRSFTTGDAISTRSAVEIHENVRVEKIRMHAGAMETPQAHRRRKRRAGISNAEAFS